MQRVIISFGRGLTICVFLGILFATITLVGCSGKKETAPVSGKVTFQGKEVKGGSITFSPIPTGDSKKPGKPASGIIQENGTFVLGTYKKADGAIIGRHRVSFSAPQPDGTGTGDAIPPSPYSGLVPKEKEVEVTAGENTFTIELVRKQ